MSLYTLSENELGRKHSTEPTHLYHHCHLALPASLTTEGPARCPRYLYVEVCVASKRVCVCLCLCSMC